MDFAKRYRIKTCSDIVRLYHVGAEDQLTRLSFNSLLQRAADHASGFERVIARHGSALANWAPDLHKKFLERLALYQFLSGHKLRGIKTVTRSAMNGLLTGTMLIIVTLGVVNRKLLAYARSVYAARKKDD